MWKDFEWQLHGVQQRLCILLANVAVLFIFYLWHSFIFYHFSCIYHLTEHADVNRAKLWQRNDSPNKWYEKILIIFSQSFSLNQSLRNFRVSWPFIIFKRISHSSPEDFPDFAEYFIRIIWSYFAEYANVGRAKLWDLIDLRSQWLFPQNKSCQSKSCDRDLFLLRGLQVWPEAWKCISRINPRQTRPLRNEPLFSKECLQLDANIAEKRF